MRFDDRSLYYIESDIKGDRYSLFSLAIWKHGLAFKKEDFSGTGSLIIKIGIK